MTLDFRLLGAVRVYIDGRRVDLGGPRTRAVLAVLLLHPGQPITREQLVKFAWPVKPTAGEDELVAVSVQRLREALVPAGNQVSLRTADRALVLDVDPAAVDVHRFLALLERPDTGLATPGFEPTRLRQAVELWRGQTTAFADVYSPWLRERAHVLEGLRLDALEGLAHLELNVGHPERAVDYLRRLLLAEPASEPLITAQILTLIATGDNVKAVDLAERARRELRQQGQLPGPSLLRAHSDAAERTRKGPTTSGGARHQLPATTRAFTGRGQELAELLDLAIETTGEAQPGVIGICAINGMAGIGKTALSVHAAHLMAHHFPDGQIFLDLHGYTTGLAPLSPADALASILNSFGIAPKQIPADLEERAALYRDRLAGTRTLIVLDNAASEAQIRPLLPGTESCLVLVTSRKRLRGLDEGPSLTLDVLPAEDAVALFRAVVGSKRSFADDALLEQLVERCGRLPLAVRIAAALLRHRPAWTLADLAERLGSSEAARLAGLRDGERNLEAIFDLSLATLDPARQRLFRRLGLIPGPSLDAYAAAALTDTNLAEVETGLQALVDHSLLAEPQPGRYRLHDLLRAYTSTRVHQDEVAEDRAAALDRLLDYYQHTAQRADWHLARLSFTYALPVARPPRAAPALSTYQEAANWMTVELANLAACLEVAATRPNPEHAIALSAAMAAYLRAHGPWTLAITLHTTAATAAQRVHDHRGHASALLGLGVVAIIAGDYSNALQTLESVVALHRRVRHQDATRSEVTFWPTRSDDTEIRVATLNRLEQFRRQISDLVTEAHALTYLSAARWIAGQDIHAAEAMARAGDRCRDATDLFDSAGSVADLINALWYPGDDPVSIDAVTRPLAHHRAVGRLRCRAIQHCYAGATSWMTGDYAGVTNGFGSATDLYRRIEALYSPEPPSRPDTPPQAPGSSRPEAALESATRIFRQISSELGLTNAMAGLGGMRLIHSATVGAATAVESAVAFYRQIGNVFGLSNALSVLGEALVILGDQERAASVLEDAISLYRQLDQRGGEVEALCRYAAIFVQTEPERAAVLYRDALHIAREIASPIDEAEALEGLGELHLRQSNPSDGIEYLRRAMTIYQRLGLHKAQQVEMRLSSVLSSDGPTE